jgi:hypothetical protein
VYCRRSVYCDLATSFTDDEELCNKGEGNNLRRKDSHMDWSHADKYANIIGFNMGSFYENMADPWLEKK